NNRAPNLKTKTNKGLSGYPVVLLVFVFKLGVLLLWSFLLSPKAWGSGTLTRLKSPAILTLLLALMVTEVAFCPLGKARLTETTGNCGSPTKSLPFSGVA